MYEEAQRIGIDDWEVYHNRGLCQLYLKNYAMACDDFKQANAIQRHDSTYMVRTQRGCSAAVRRGTCTMLQHSNGEPAAHALHAMTCFAAAVAVGRVQQLGKVYTLQENYEAAIEVYLEALESVARADACARASTMAAAHASKGVGG